MIASTPDLNSKVIVIGAGIVGNSVVYHLAKKGWTNITQIDKGPLPNPGGSTGHASNFIFPVDHGKEITMLTLDSVKQYTELGVLIECGGIEVARTEERMQELTRRMASSKSWGIESKLLSPAEIKELVPFINEDILLGGFYTPSVSVVDSLRAGTIMRDYAKDQGALTTMPNVEVLDIQVDDGKVTGVKTTKGHLEADYVVIACGLWGPRIAKMAGATIPLVPTVHQMISVGPVPIFENTVGEIEYPIVRDMDALMYERQHGGDMEVGSYAHRAILHKPDDIPSIEESALSPTEAPFTEEDFDPQMEDALELMPDIIGDENVGVRYAINGLLSYTGDGSPVLGETTEVKNLWSASAVWIKEGPGVGRLIAEWMTDGYPEIDPHQSDIARFYDHQRTEYHVESRVSEGFIKTYGIVHPAEQWTANRNVRHSPFYERQRALDACFFETAGWERPQWYEGNAGLLEVYGDRVSERSAEWDSRWWSPIINAEHLHMRDHVAMLDLSAFNIFDIEGPGALDFMQMMTVNQMKVKVGRSVYTPMLTYQGGFKADLTITRTAKDKFRVVSGSADGGLDKFWFKKHMPDDGSVSFSDHSSAYTAIGVWGPKAQALIDSVTDSDMSIEAFPYGMSREIYIGSSKIWALRISYVGENGWELHIPMEYGLAVWDRLWAAGQEQQVIAAGMGVYGTTARLEKGYRLYGAELEGEYNPVEAGLARPKVKKADFIGKEAFVKALGEDPAAILCSLTVDDHSSSTGEKRYMLGGEPILTPDGGRIVDSHGRGSYVTSAGAGPSIGKHILMGYLPPEYAVEGTQLKVEYMGEQYPVTVASAGSRPLFDPDNERMRG